MLSGLILAESLWIWLHAHLLIGMRCYWVPTRSATALFSPNTLHPMHCALLEAQLPQRPPQPAAVPAHNRSSPQPFQPATVPASSRSNPQPFQPTTAQLTPQPTTALLAAHLGLILDVIEGVVLVFF